MRPHKVPDYLVPAHSLHLLPTVSQNESEVSLSMRMEKLESAVQALTASAARGPGVRPGEGQVNVLQKGCCRQGCNPGQEHNLS